MINRIPPLWKDRRDFSSKWGIISVQKPKQDCIAARFPWSDPCVNPDKQTYFMNLFQVCLAGGIAFSALNIQAPVTMIEPCENQTTDTVPSKTMYRDLGTGEVITIWYDAAGIRTLNKKTGAPVDFYINTSTNDTVFGRGRFIVNGYVIKDGEGKWKLDDAKLKVDGDELKLKVGDQKLKIDGDEIKIKGNGIKVKSEKGEVKVKSDEGKAKYEEKDSKVKSKPKE